MENRKPETGNEKLVNAPPTPFARFPFPVSGFLFFILLAACRTWQFAATNPVLSPVEGGSGP